MYRAKKWPQNSTIEKLLLTLMTECQQKKYGWNSNCSGFRGEGAGESEAYSCVKVRQEEW